MKMIYSHYDPETGISKVVLADKRGKYTGKAKVHPDDKESANRFAGPRLAEYRAWIKYFKSEVRRIKERLDTVTSLKEEINKYADPDEKTKRRLNLKIRDYSKELIELREAIKILTERLDEQIKLRQELLKKIGEKKE